jgi:membrane-bound lytic murein transglycosylase D
MTYIHGFGRQLRRGAALAGLLAAAATAQVVPARLALAALADADNAGAAPPPASAIPVMPVVPQLSASTMPPKPSWKDERLNQAEAMYEAGYKLHVAGDRAGARKQFDAAIELVLDTRVEAVNRSFDRRFDALVQKIYRVDVDTLSAEKPAYDKAPIDEILPLTFPVDPKLKMKVRDEVAATVSQLPLEASDAVLSFINYFNGDRGKRTLIAGLRRAGKYKPMISRILDEEGIPQEFIFLAQAESGFLPRAMSYMAAGGMWQFIRGTGSVYGLQQTQWVDERFDPELATRAAARHLRDLYHEFGDWYLAIAAYNCGHGNVQRAVEKTGYADVWELRSRGTLPLETSNYVPIILAMTIMSKNPDNYGIADVIPDEPLVYDTVETPTMTSLQLIADILARPVAELKDLNPALLKDVAPAGYKLHIPRGAGQTLMAGLERVPADRRLAWRVYRSEPGETAAVIAARYRLTPAALTAANPAIGDEIEAGTLLVIPAAPAPVVTARRAPARGTTARATVASARKPVVTKKPAAKTTASAKKPAPRTRG